MASRTHVGRAAAACAPGIGLAAALAQRRHLRRIASDPERAILQEPLRGEPLAVRSADGTALHVRVFGTPARPTLVLVPGWTETIPVWTYVIRELRDQFRIVAYDLRGHGASGRPPRGDYSIARFGEDLEAVLAVAVDEGERAIVAGHSLGGISIAAWAAGHDVTARAGGAALLFTGLGGLIGGQLLVHVPRLARALSETVARRGFLGARAPLPRFSTPISAALISYIAFGPAATPAQVAFYERMLVDCAADVRAAVGLAMADVELHGALARLAVPTLVMAGLNDRLTPPAHARRIAAALPELAELIELPDTGHMGPLERPGEIAAALRRLATRTLEAAPAII